MVTPNCEKNLANLPDGENLERGAKQDCARDRILQAAGVIFSEKGFRKATVREICEAADANIASINYYFGDKKNLYVETLLLAREIGANQFPTPNFSSFTTPEQRLQAIILLLLNRLVANQAEPWPVKILMAEILDPSPSARPLIDGYIDPFISVVFETVKELMGPAAPAELVQQTGFSIIAQCVYYRFADTMNAMVIGEDAYRNDFSVNTLAKQVYEFSLAGIMGTRQVLNGSNVKKDAELNTSVV